MVLDEEDNSKVHNLLYSFLPVGKANYPALVGFCKDCRHTFSYVMKLSGINFIDAHSVEAYTEFDAQIPKYGCHPVD